MQLLAVEREEKDVLAESRPDDGDTSFGRLLHGDILHQQLVLEIGVINGHKAVQLLASASAQEIGNGRPPVAVVEIPLPPFVRIEQALAIGIR